MADQADNENYQDDLLDFEEEEEAVQDIDGLNAVGDTAKKGHVGMHASGFKDFLLRQELLTGISNCGFEHPSQVQQECIPQAILGVDVLCQAKSGMGKTAVFVIACLQQADFELEKVQALVLCHTRELAQQISSEFKRFASQLPKAEVAVVYGGINLKTQKEDIKKQKPRIVVGTPGRVLDLAKSGDLNLKSVRFFVLDECDKMLESLDMRKDVQDIYKLCPIEKQVMMFSATLSKEIRPVCKKFMTNPMELYVDNESKLTLHGLLQHFVRLEEKEKTARLIDLLDSLEFNQLVVFVKSVGRAGTLNNLLTECNFPSICIHSRMTQAERLDNYKLFKGGVKRILVATDLVGRGIDIERINVVINYDTPDSADSYLHRVGRAGRFGTKGLALTFVTGEEDAKKLQMVQDRFMVDIQPMPANVKDMKFTKEEK